MKPAKLISLAFLVFILGSPPSLFAYGEVPASISKTDDSTQWLNQLYEKSGHSISDNNSQAEILPAAHIPDLSQAGDMSTNASAPPGDQARVVSNGAPNPEPEGTASSKNPEAVDWRTWATDTATPLKGERVKVSGHYHIGAGSNFRDFIVNDSNSDLQDWNYHYLYGERLNNTYDPAIYSQYLLNVDFSPLDKTNIHTQIVADPWSYVGQTGEQVQKSDVGHEEIRYNLKYFGANNSTIAQFFRTNVGDAVNFPVIKVNDGHLTGGTVVHGFYDFNPATNGIPFTVPELDVNYEFRPFRKLWIDHDEDNWHARVFALADQSQALTTDDPLGLSNHKDYWQQSPWLYQYQPIQFFSDGSVQRGYYSDLLSFYAKDSEGNRLVLLRGASIEANLGKTYLASTVAAPYTPWDEKYFAADNIPGVVRIKHQATDKLMVGGTYAFRSGLINNSVADFNQNVGVDTKYKINDNVTAKAEVAGSRREMDVMTDDRLKTSLQGYAYKAELGAKFNHKFDGNTDASLSYAQMDRNYQPALSRYSNTRDDHDWGTHIQFMEYSPELESYRLGDGVDVDRMVVRFNWKEKLFKDKFMNLFDVRNVHKQHNTAYKETVLRNETTYKIDKKTTVKGLFRWQGLPQSTPYVEPFLSNYYFIGFTDPSNLSFQNVDVPADKDASRFTYSGGIQYVFNSQWTGEGIYEYTNNIPDFPRGNLNSTFRDSNDRVDGLLIEHLTNFLYGQGALGAVPPYRYFSIFKERLSYKPDEKITVTFHSTQNTYRFAASNDDNINHQGVSLGYDYSKKVSFFMDFSHTQLIDIPKFIATHYAEKDYGGHENFYASMDYRINASTVFRAEYGVFGLSLYAPQTNPYSAVPFNFPTIDTEHLLRVSLTGDF